jgi:3-methyladenine DNA glycosylase AlkD
MGNFQYIADCFRFVGLRAQGAVTLEQPSTRRIESPGRYVDIGGWKPESRYWYRSREMKQLPETACLAREICSRLSLLTAPDTAALRRVRQEFSRRIVHAAPQSVVQLALHLLADDSDLLRFVAYEIVSHHKLTFDQLTRDDLLKLGAGLNSWSSVDCFAMYLSGPMWVRGRVSEKTITAWARGKGRWWRRAALVSTVPLSRRGSADDLLKVARICTMLAADRDDMVVKALSWALREIAKKHPEQSSSFLAEHRHVLAARVVREVNNKLTTGLKTPRSTAKARNGAKL